MDHYIDIVVTYLGQLKRNIWGSFVNMTPQKYIRLIAVLGAYMLLRPYLVKLGVYIQSKEHAKVYAAAEAQAAKSQASVKPAAISPNSLRGHVEPQIPADSDNEAEAEATGANWGKKARKRQRQMVRKVVEAEEKMRQEQDESEDDEEIVEFLQEQYGVASMKE